MNRTTALLIALIVAFPCFSQDRAVDSMVNKLTGYAYAIENFGNALPQEKVYVHFDNTSYCQGDQIWFQAYVVTSELNRPTELSKTLYVELLNPGGEIVAKQVLPVLNGRCRGDFALAQLPFYSGFYEVRAYTKYMLNFGDEQIFSRVFPVFEKPKEPGNYAEKNIQPYAVYKYPQKREIPKKEKKLNLKFYPEGGNLVEAVPSRVAFEATDTYGTPVEAQGVVIDREKNTLAAFSAAHQGRGVFTYTPVGKGNKAVVELNGKKYSFDMPEPLPQGFTMRIDNLSSADSVLIAIQKSARTPAAIMGLAVMCRGKLVDFCALNLKTDKAVRIGLNKTGLPDGMAQIVLFDANGRTVADRLIFTRKPAQLVVGVRKDRNAYQPYDPVELEFSLRDTEGEPVRAALSVAVRDGMNEVENGNSMLTDLLLMSEIKGYVHRPAYYFEADDEERRAALDLLLMVQGWRRYAWNYWSGARPFELKYSPEQGVEVHGQVVSLARNRPRPNVQISSFLTKRGEDEAQNATFISSFDTDSLGRFAFITDIQGKWGLILSVTEKGKKRDHQIILDRVFSPEPAKYSLAQMRVNVAAGDEEADADRHIATATPAAEEFDYDALIKSYEDSLAKAGIHEKIHRVEEVVVKAKRQSQEKDVYRNRSQAIAFYDVVSEIDDIKDQGGFIGNDMHELMINMNPDFSRLHYGGYEYLLYKHKRPLFVINYKPVTSYLDFIRYQSLPPESIKAIYINETSSAKIKYYVNPKLSASEIDAIFSCVVFIETFPDEQAPAKAGKGVRKTWLDGYSEVKEFYQPDYSILPKENDYRRTLYWNPELMPDDEGNVKIRFYNNGRIHKLKISAETVADDGTIGILNE